MLQIQKIYRKFRVDAYSHFSQIISLCELDTLVLKKISEILWPLTHTFSLSYILKQ